MLAISALKATAAVQLERRAQRELKRRAQQAESHDVT